MNSVHDAVAAWRSGTRRSQLVVLAVLVVGTLGTFAVSWHDYASFPVAGYFVWLLLGRVLLRFLPMLVHAVVLLTAATAAVTHVGLQEGALARERGAALVALLACTALVLFVSSRQRGALPGPLSEALLAELRTRLNAQGTVPALPHGWHAQSAMLTAFGVGYAGDFMVADLDEEEERLDLVLVDVVGKGVTAAPAALLFAGALGGLVGALRGPALFEAANDFLLRQESDETFATAVHVSVDLRGGGYTILSAGHPPALRWCPRDGEWLVDGSRGLALGVLPHPELHASTGVLEPGQALLFYTDGVVEARGEHIDEGIAWLQRTAADVFTRGVDGAAQRIIARVPRGDDDRALLILSRAGRSAG